MELIRAAEINYVIDSKVIWVGVDTYVAEKKLDLEYFLDALDQMDVVVQDFPNYFKDDHLFFNWFQLENKSMMMENLKNLNLN